MQAKPLLSFPMDHILPCNLHQVMAVVRAMVARLSELADEEPQVAVALEEVLLSNCKIKLVKAETKSKKKRKFSQRVEKSRLSRPELLNIVEEQRDIMNVFKEKSIKISEDRKKKVVLAHSSFHVYLLYDRWCSYGSVCGTYLKKRWLRRAT